ncbi:hypothetical protein ACCO45_011455 [Purpureocillium lilacinum]|uniref:Uncharacterized protein n=1 Tax=Purpureocillium lilacinum TaxID=33203 RepID=A0ACC4DCD9_PURLI
MALLSPFYLGVAAVLLMVVHLVRCLSSPLRKVPGPTVSLFTTLVLKWKELNAGRTMYVHELHQKYGPVVRVSPNEVSFTSWPALKEIYCSGGSGYDKSDFYNLFRIYGRRTMFTTLNKADHAKRKRILADRYANTNVMRSLPMQGIQERSRAFVRRCASTSGKKTSEIFVALHAYACDCITHHLFHPNGSDCLGKKEDEAMMHQVAADDSLQSEDPRGPTLRNSDRLISHYNPTLHRLFAGVLSLFVKPREVPLADNYVLETSKRTDAASFTLMSRLEEKSGELDAIDMAAECLDHMVAAAFLSYQRRLTEELRSKPEASIDQLPFLDAVLNEALRCFPAIPMSLPRLVPQGGRMVDGVWLPEGTIVSCQAYSVHRINEDVFPEPDKFDPDRWLAPEGDTDRRRLLFAFSNGGRGCVGKHLALAEMKTLLRDVYSQFSTTPDASMTQEAMAMSDQLISTRPMAQRCLLQFHPLVDAPTEKL